MTMNKISAIRIAAVHRTLAAYGLTKLATKLGGVSPDIAEYVRKVQALRQDARGPNLGHAIGGVTGGVGLGLPAATLGGLLGSGFGAITSAPNEGVEDAKKWGRRGALTFGALGALAGGLSGGRRLGASRYEQLVDEAHRALDASLG